MQNNFIIQWDEKQLAQAFRVQVEDVREYFMDGSRVIHHRTALEVGSPRLDFGAV